VSCSSSLGSAPPIICDHGLSRVMAAYMLNLNMESGANIKLTVISLVCVCVCVCVDWRCKRGVGREIVIIVCSTTVKQSCSRCGLIDGKIVLGQVPVIIEVEDREIAALLQVKLQVCMCMCIRRRSKFLL